MILGAVFKLKKGEEKEEVGCFIFTSSCIFKIVFFIKFVVGI